MTSRSSNIRLILLADTHLGFDYPIRPRIQLRRRGYDFFDNFQSVLNHAIEVRADFVIHGGDFFFRSKIPQKIIDLAYQILFEFSETTIPFIIVPGNHERSRLPDSLLFTHPNIHIFDRPKTMTFEKNATKIVLSGFPFIRHDIRDSFPGLLSETEWRSHPADIRLLCLHQAIQGARVGSSDYTFRYGKDVIRMKDIPNDFMAVVSGHIYRQQVLLKTSNHGSSTIPVIYPGSTERTSFAEKAEDKGFYEMDLCPAGKERWKILSLKFKHLPTRPMIDLILDGDITQENVKSVILTKISQLDSDSIVRLKIEGELDHSIREMLTSRFLRTLFPPSINFQFSSDFYRDRTKM